MKIGKYTAALALCAVLFFSVYIPVSAGTYTVTQAVSCDFAETPVAIKNKLGFTMSVTPYVCNTPVTNVTRITGYYRPTAILLNIGFIDIDVYYSKDGSAYTYGTRIENIDVGRQYSYSITISGSPATVYSITFVPNLMYVPGISYSLTSPRCTCLLTDNTPPTVSLHEQDEYSNTGVTIYADAADSESGVAVMKWAMGTQSASYFANEGTEFSSSFTISTTGIVTVYVKDNAGNETVALYTITKYDPFPPVISASVPTVYNPANTITVSITDNQSGIFIRKWAYGSYAASYFASGGNTLSGNTFTVDRL